MERRRPRILVLARDRAAMENIHRALDGLPDLDPEVDLLLDLDGAVRRLGQVAYDLVVLGPGDEKSLDGPEALRPPPVLTVGASLPEDRWENVPLPLSFSLFARAVRVALGAGRPKPDEARPRRRDQVG